MHGLDANIIYRDRRVSARVGNGLRTPLAQHGTRDLPRPPGRSLGSAVLTPCVQTTANVVSDRSHLERGGATFPL